jgi:hypothetical protein
MLRPEVIVGPRMTRLAKRCQVMPSIGIAHILKKTMRDYMVAIKRLPCPNFAAMLADKFVAHQDGARYFRPILAAIG